MLNYQRVWVKIEYPSYSMVNTENRLQPVVSEVLNFDPYLDGSKWQCFFVRFGSYGEDFHGCPMAIAVNHFKSAQFGFL